MFVLGLSPKYIKEVANLHEFIKGLRRIKEIPFITMGIIQKIYNLSHDSMPSYIMWFHDNELLETTRLISCKFIQRLIKVEFIGSGFVVWTWFKGRGICPRGEFVCIGIEYFSIYNMVLLCAYIPIRFTTVWKGILPTFRLG